MSNSKTAKEMWMDEYRESLQAFANSCEQGWCAFLNGDQTKEECEAHKKKLVDLLCYSVKGIVDHMGI